MESKHDGLEDDVPFQTPVFQVSCWFVGDYALFLFWKVWWWCLQRWWSANTVVVLAASLGTRGFLVQVVELQNTYFWENTCICSLDVYIYDIISNIDNNAILYIYIYIPMYFSGTSTTVVDVLNSIFMLAPLHGESHWHLKGGMPWRNGEPTVDGRNPKQPPGNYVKPTNNGIFSYIFHINWWVQDFWTINSIRWLFQVWFFRRLVTSNDGLLTKSGKNMSLFQV